VKSCDNQIKETYAVVKALCLLCDLAWKEKCEVTSGHPRTCYESCRCGSRQDFWDTISRQHLIEMPLHSRVTGAQFVLGKVSVVVWHAMRKADFDLDIVFVRAEV